MSLSDYGRMDPERGMEEILEEIRRMCADEERAADRDREVEAAVRAFERLALSTKRNWAATRWRRI